MLVNIIRNMKVIFGFNALNQDGMSSTAITLMRALKDQGVNVQPVHAWRDIKVPNYEEEFHPIFVTDSEDEPNVKEVIQKMVSIVNSDNECKIFSHFGSPNWACIVPYLREDIRVVVSCHSITPSALKISLAYKERASAFVPVSWEVEEKLKSKLSKTEQSKIHLVTNVVDPEKFIPKTNYQHSGKIKIIFFGRVEDVTKGCDKIPLIAKQLKERNIDFEWDLYGYFHWGFEERFYPLLKEHDVEDVVNYKRCLNADEIPQILPQYDIMVMPSNHEGCPNALLEAMCVGLPCVASLLHFVTDKIVIDGKDGALAHKNDISGFAEKISELATNSAYRESVGQAARAKVLKDFSIEKQGKGYKEIFDKVLASHNYRMVCAPDIENFRQPSTVKPHILARILPLWFKRLLKKYI